MNFVTKSCVKNCVKKEPPDIKPKASLGTNTRTQPIEIASIDFLYLDHCLGGYEYRSSHQSCSLKIGALKNLSKSTGSSYHLLFGYKPHIPVDSILAQSLKVDIIISYMTSTYLNGKKYEASTQHSCK